MDPRARARLWETVHAAAAGGAGVLVTTHHLEEAKECDRLVMMSAGRVVAQGPLAEIVGDRMTVAVATPDWAAAYTALASAGLPAALVGRDLRVPGSDLPRVEAVLGAARVDAGLRSVPATFEETFVALARGGRDSTDRRHHRKDLHVTDPPPRRTAARGRPSPAPPTSTRATRASGGSSSPSRSACSWGCST